MSRIGRKPVEVPNGVDVNIVGNLLKVKGPKGEITCKIARGISFERTDNILNVQRSGDSPKVRANHGLMRALLYNMVTGVSKGYQKQLEIVGVGYKAEARGNAVVLHLGYSHPIEYPFPEGIKIEVDKKKTGLTVSGFNKEVVGQVSAELRGFRPPDSYKGKGVRYKGEHIRLKAGKSGQ